MTSKVWEWITGGVTALIDGIKAAAGTIVAKVLGAFGLSIVSFETILPNLKSFVMGYVSGLPAQALEFLGAIGLGEAMSMILSALTIRLASKVFIVPTSVAQQLGGTAP